MSTRVGSLFAGIGGFDLAAERVGMTVAWQSEIDPFASRVLAHRFPGVPNLGDVRGLSYGVPAVDVLCGGFPCQDVSVAGLRAGLAGERSGLFWEIARLALDLRPTWLLLENVPGLLSSNDGRDMGAVLGALGHCGYGYAYRVLDAQFFGIPQRRRRVFIVACAAGDVRRAAAVLFEPEGGAGDSAPRRASGQDVAYALASSVRGTGDGHGNAHNTTYVPVASDEPFVGQQHGSDVGRFGTLRAEGTTPGNGLPFVAHAIWSHPDRQDATSDTYIAFDDPRRFDNRHGGSGEHRDIHPTLESINPKTLVANTLRASDGHHGFSSPRGDGGDNLVVAAGLSENVRGEVRLTPYSSAITTGGGKPGQGYAAAFTSAGVRRLTPVECERLMGLPDAWTCLADHAQPCSCSDGPRYRALGNAVAVPVIEWILRRLIEVAS